MGNGATRTNRSRNDRADVDSLIDAAVASCIGPFGRPQRELIEMLVDRSRTSRQQNSSDQDLVAEALGRALLAAVGAAWRLYWQPADIPRMLARIRSREHARLAAEVVVRQTQSYPAGELPPGWRSQIDAIDPGVRSLIDDHRWAVTAPRTDGDLLAAIIIAVETVATLRRLPQLAKIGPIPGEREPSRRVRTGTPSHVDRHVDPGILHRVTSLLAKAESTTFPEEAEAATAKAQEFMARHAIDAALIADTDGSRQPDVASARRIGVDDPYAGAKASLLDVIAMANRCRSVWSKSFGFATVFGDELDLDTVALLYTSLLIQSTRAMIAASPPRASSIGSRTRSFRHSFLVAFAARIGERLRDAVASAVADAEAEHQSDLLPVLANREAAADAACQAAFPTVGSFSTSANDPAGRDAGRQAADRAQLDMNQAMRPTTSPLPLHR